MAIVSIWLLAGLFLLSGCAVLDMPTDIRGIPPQLGELEVDASMIDGGVKVVLPEVFLFAYNSDRLKRGAMAQLDRIAVLVNSPEFASHSIIVQGHSDAIGPKAYNLDLSERRSQSVGRALVFSGVRQGRIVTRGFGESMPVAPNIHPDGSDFPEGRMQNRRVEIIIEK